MKELTAYETRVIGCLIEKSLTTPDQYPLSLNALANACNQKSNREPVMELPEAKVQETVDGLVQAGLVTEVSGFGSRVVKYQHRFCNTEFSENKLSPQELGIICVLFLRGPQTSGELRTRTNRLCSFDDVFAVEKVLHRMMQREGGPLVEKLPREPGRRESRYRHLFGDDASTEQPGQKLRYPLHQELDREPNRALQEPAPESGDASRMEQLEARVEALSGEVAELKELVNELLNR